MFGFVTKRITKIWHSSKLDSLNLLVLQNIENRTSADGINGVVRSIYCMINKVINHRSPPRLSFSNTGPSTQN